MNPVCYQSLFIPLAKSITISSYKNCYVFALIFTDLTFQPRNWDGKAKNKGKNNTTKKPCISYSYINSNIDSNIDLILIPILMLSEPHQILKKKKLNCGKNKHRKNSS